MNSEGSQKQIIIFAREPEKGGVKTRLSSVLSEEERTCLYRMLLKDVMSLVSKVRGCKKLIAYHSSGEPVFIRSQARDGIGMVRQYGRDLGERMYNALTLVRGDDARKVLIGSDCPTLPYKYIDKAFNALLYCDLVLGPSNDGGYYLMGVKKVHGGLFTGIQWGGRTVLQKTLDLAGHMDLDVELLRPWYDVDLPEDLERLAQDDPQYKVFIH